MRRVSSGARSTAVRQSLPDAHKEVPKRVPKRFPLQNRRFPRDEGDAATRALPRRSPEVLRIAGTSSTKRPYINYESACSEGSVASG